MVLLSKCVQVQAGVIVVSFSTPGRNKFQRTADLVFSWCARVLSKYFMNMYKVSILEYIPCTRYVSFRGLDSFLFTFFLLRKEPLEAIYSLSQSVFLPTIRSSTDLL